MKPYTRHPGYYLLAVTLLINLLCDPGVGDGGNILVVDSRVAGTFYEPDGTPAEGAMVIMRPMKYLPSARTLAKRATDSAAFICSTITSGKGAFFFDSVVAGTFLIEGISSDAENRGFVDSIVLDARILRGDSSVRLDSVPLKAPASIRGTVRSAGDSATGLVFVVGFDTYAATDADGNFLLENLPEGVHRLEIVVSIADHQSITHVSALARSSETTVLDTIEPSLYLIRYNGNGSDGGTVPVDNVYYAVGDTVNVSPDTMNFSRSCFSFIGWNTRSDGSGKAFTPGVSFVMDTAEEILYAQWTPLRYSLTVAAGGNGTATGSDSVSCGVAKLITAAPGAGFRFLGWHVQEGTATIADTSSASTSVTLTDGNAVVVAAFGAGSSIVFKRTYGGTNSDAGYSVQKTSDGGYILCGLTRSFGAGDNDVYLIKTDVNGDTLWTRTFGGSQNDFGKCVQVCSDGGYIITGLTSSFGAGFEDVYLIRTDAGGNLMWSTTFGGIDVEAGNSVEPTADGGFILCGYTSSFGGGASAAYLIRTDADGDSLWTRTFGNQTGHNEGYAVQVAADGGYAVAGYSSTGPATVSDVYLIRTDADGNELWTRTYGGSGDEQGWAMRRTNSGYIITGYSPAGLYLLNVAGDGAELWSKTYSGSGRSFGYSVDQTGDGGYIIAGKTETGIGANSGIYLVKTDVNGDSLWSRTFGESQSNFPRAVLQADDGGFVIIGCMLGIYDNATEITNDEVYLIKTDADGGVQ